MDINGKSWNQKQIRGLKFDNFRNSLPYIYIFTCHVWMEWIELVIGFTT